MDFKNYRREFWSSQYHAYMGLSTIGMGLLSGHLFGVILGAFAYSMGWLYLPDSKFFKDSVDGKEAAVKKRIFTTCNSSIIFKVLYYFI